MSSQASVIRTTTCYMCACRCGIRVHLRDGEIRYIGVNHPKIVQKSMGFTGGSFNTREFFHGATVEAMHRVRLAFLQLGFVIPIVLMVAGAITESVAAYVAAFAIQYAGLVMERWFFLAQANHPQNLYYQNRS